MMYFGWQIMDMKNVDDSVSTALKVYIAKHGLPDQILLETSLESVKLPEGMNIIVQSVRIPKNIILIEEFHATKPLGVETLEEQK